MRRFAALLLPVSLFVLACGGSGGDGEVVAVIGDRSITTRDVDRRLAEMPQRIQGEFVGPEGRKKLIEGLMDEEAFLLAAEEQDLEKNPEVKRQIDSARRRVLIQAYYNREVVPYTQMTEEDMRDYYDEHMDLFTRPEESEVRQVVVESEETAARVRRMLLDGATWEHVVGKYCTDLPTKKRNGRIGPVQKNASIIPLVGTSAELSRCIDTLTIGTISPVIKGPKGYHVFTVEQRNAEAVMPFEKVQETIRRNYASAFAEEVRKAKVKELHEKYGSRILKDPTQVVESEELDEDRQAAKIFQLAQNATDPLQRIKYYDEIVRNHPDDPYACEAQFMIGFVYSEELHNFDRAREAFEKVLARGGDGCKQELIDSATWMLQNMGGTPPEFNED
ncbi:MAG: peptidyl-prolyl cis-trans isomerase [Candidatus Eisenbacteria bacterium]|nr:peptidyl-prolyl cis-trans isomerase [Candidatus Eisenbacteria bacterium]